MREGDIFRRVDLVDSWKRWVIFSPTGGTKIWVTTFVSQIASNQSGGCPVPDIRNSLGGSLQRYFSSDGVQCGEHSSLQWFTTHSESHCHFIHPLVEDGSLPVRSGYESFTRLGMVIRPIHFVGTAEAPFQLLPTK
jgi:hypothetical protein